MSQPPSPDLESIAENMPESACRLKSKSPMTFGNNSQETISHKQSTRKQSDRNSQPRGSDRGKREILQDKVAKKAKEQIMLNDKLQTLKEIAQEASVIKQGNRQVKRESQQGSKKSKVKAGSDSKQIKPVASSKKRLTDFKDYAPQTSSDTKAVIIENSEAKTDIQSTSKQTQLELAKSPKMSTQSNMKSGTKNENQLKKSALRGDRSQPKSGKKKVRIDEGLNVGEE